MSDATMTPEGPSRPDYRPHRLNGQRGRTLLAITEREGVGQRCIAARLDVPQPALSALLNEKFGGLPRGFARRYLAAMREIIEARVGLCWDGCGCRKCRDCGARAAVYPTGPAKWCGGGACARVRASQDAS